MPVTQNVSWGIIISTRSLVLQKVQRIHAGQYACAAANDRGETQSVPVPLRIQCKCYRFLLLNYSENLFLCAISCKERTTTTRERTKTDR